jgi:hypothetical protein
VVAEYPEPLRPAYPSQGPDPVFGLHSAFLIGELVPLGFKWLAPGS